MATTYTCGTTGRTYSTLQAAEDAIPATPTGGYEIHCYNDSEFTAPVQFSGHTTSGANYIKLTAATGQSFQDHASVRTNPLFYDQTKGVGLLVDDAQDYGIRIDDANVTIDRLQIKKTTAFYSSNEWTVDFQSTAGTSSKIKDCIIGKTFSGTAHIVRLRNSNIINCVVYDSGATASNNAVSMLETGTALNCTVVRVGTAGGAGITRTYTNNANTSTNTAVFNWTANFDSTTGWSGTTGYNATNSATVPGSNGQTSKTFSSQFESVTNDFRLKSGADCIGTGNTDGTNAPLDISAFTRGTTTAGDIGAWEFGAAGGGATLSGSAMTGGHGTQVPSHAVPL